MKSLSFHFVFFAFFRKRVSYTSVFSPFIVRCNLKFVFFDFSKTHLVQKKGLQVHRTTMWASSSHTRASLKVFFSSSARPFPLENVIRNACWKWKLQFFSEDLFFYVHLFKCWYWGLEKFYSGFFSCIWAWVLFFFVISRHIALTLFLSYFDRYWKLSKCRTLFSTQSLDRVTIKEMVR